LSRFLVLMAEISGRCSIPTTFPPGCTILAKTYFMSLFRVAGGAGGYGSQVPRSTSHIKNLCPRFRILFQRSRRIGMHMWCRNLSSANIPYHTEYSLSKANTLRRIMVRHHIRIMRSIDFLSRIRLQIRHWSYKHSFIHPLRCDKSIITKIIDKFRITSPGTKLVDRHARRGGEGTLTNAMPWSEMEGSVLHC
jgi:hypothetical protein